MSQPPPPPSPSQKIHLGLPLGFWKFKDFRGESVNNSLMQI